MITVKFGGTSLADAQHIRHAAEIIRANPERRFVVVSAPGKRFSEDIKTPGIFSPLRNALGRSSVNWASRWTCLRITRR